MYKDTSCFNIYMYLDQVLVPSVRVLITHVHVYTSHELHDLFRGIVVIVSEYVF
jgi:hypothetical protein